jgi:hypothetical protein
LRLDDVAWILDIRTGYPLPATKAVITTFLKYFCWISFTMIALGRFIKDNISCMCMYDIPNITDEESLRRLISSHSHVIIDYPYIVYVAAGEEN